MATLPSNIADLVLNIHDNELPNQFQQVAQSIVKYVMWKESLKNGPKQVLDGGEQISRAIMNTLGTGAKMTGIFENDTVTAQDHFARVVAPWRFLTDAIMYDAKEFMVMGGEKTRILDYVLGRRKAGMLRVIELAEEQAFNVPANVTTDLTAWGIPFWVQQMLTTTANGFLGTVPNGITTVGGITPSTTNNWQNWSGNFTGNYDSDDGVFTVLAEALANIGFETPIPIPGHKEGGKGSYKIYCRYTTQKGLKRCARAGNQQVGYDINNDVTIDGIPFTWVPSMDDAVINDSAGTAISATKTLAGNGHPIYIIDHSVLHAVVNKRNGLIRISPPTNANTGGHDKFAVFYDMMFNFICVDRRRCAALRGDISIA